MPMKKSLLLIALCPLLLTGCAGMLVGAGATAGVAAAQEGGVKRAWSDAQIQAQINKLWFEYDVDTFAKLDLTINQGRVLITGVVQNPEARVEAVRLAWQPKGVKQVINEIRVAKSGGVTGFARDTWITSRLRTAITFDRNIQSINYSIDTVQGTVYLMGSAQNQQELNRVIETARTIPDVKQVVSYVKLLGRPVLSNGAADSVRHSNNPPADSMGAERWPDEQPVQSYGTESTDYKPVLLVPEPVQSEQLN
ncbi:MAG: BON domain-containing protein [Alphaproteobacteria bacterium PRO2]|nr:BON domain-containing protein [Alphaproteobacteria bacterium PRO2]